MKVPKIDENGPLSILIHQQMHAVQYVTKAQSRTSHLLDNVPFRNKTILPS